MKPYSQSSWALLSPACTFSRLTTSLWLWIQNHFTYQIRAIPAKMNPVNTISYWICFGEISEWYPRILFDTTYQIRYVDMYKSFTWSDFSLGLFHHPSLKRQDPLIAVNDLWLLMWSNFFVFLRACRSHWAGQQWFIVISRQASCWPYGFTSVAKNQTIIPVWPLSHWLLRVHMQIKLIFTAKAVDETLVSLTVNVGWCLAHSHHQCRVWLPLGFSLLPLMDHDGLFCPLLS